MSKNAQESYKELFGEFEKVIKRVRVFKTQNRPIPSDENKVSKYKSDLVNAYNNCVNFIAKIYNSQTPQLKQDLHDDFNLIHKPKLLEVLEIIGYTAQIPENFIALNIDTVTPIEPKTSATVDRSQIDTGEHSQINTSESGSTATANQNEKETHDNKQSGQISDTLDSDNSSEFEDPENESNIINSSLTRPENLVDRQTENMPPKMEPQTKAEFLKMASGILNYKFNGDPLKLKSFLADVEMVAALAEEPNKAFCLTFIKAKLEQKALECLPDDIEELKDITNALKNNIKSESSEVVDGKILALRLVKGNFSEFTKRAEELADEYRRSLIDEGITKAKAEQMAIKKTIELCRRVAISETVKSVVQSTKYEKPSEVLATFVTQCDIAKKEKREAEVFKQNLSKNSNGFRGKNKFGRGGNRGQNGQNRDSREQRDGRGRYQSRGTGNYRGNGNQRGFGRNQYAQPRNEQTIRLVAAQAPQPAQNIPQSSQTDQLNEQFFRLSA